MKKWIFAFVLGSTLLFSSTQASASFRDVSNSHPYAESINTLKSYNIIAGYPDGSFRPNQTIERQQIAGLLTRAIPVDYKYPLKPFKDVDFSERHYQRIMPLQQAGIMGGTGNGYFQPYASLTRAQLATILMRAFNLQPTESSSFDDVPATHWAKESVDALASHDILLPSQRNAFLPDQAVTRGEYAELLKRSLTTTNNGELNYPKHVQRYVPKYNGRIKVLFNSASIRQTVYPYVETLGDYYNCVGCSSATYNENAYLKSKQMSKTLDNMASKIAATKSPKEANAFRTSYSYWKRTMEQKSYKAVSDAFGGHITSTGSASIYIGYMNGYLQKIEEWLHLYGND